MNIVFMGSPIQAASTLQTLIDSEHNVIAVYTKPPKPAGRGKKLIKTPVQELSEKNDILLRNPKSLKSEEIHKQFADLKPDITIVSAYGLLIPDEIINASKYNPINIHPSLLPRWRGASPVQYTLMNGDKESGVCIIDVTSELDAGDIYNMKKIPVRNDHDYESLLNELFEIGNNLLMKTLDEIMQNKSNKLPQEITEDITYAHKTEKFIIDPNTQSAEHIYNMIRGLSPHPGVFLEVKGEQIKILSASYKDCEHSKQAGDINSDDFSLYCNRGILYPSVLQKPGKKKLEVNEFIKGFRF